LIIDSIPALSIAATSFQLVDYGSKLSSEGKELYNSANGASSEDVAIQAASERLQNLSGTIVGSPGQTTPRAPQDTYRRHIGQYLQGVHQDIKGIVSQIEESQSRIRSQVEESVRQLLKPI